MNRKKIELKNTDQKIAVLIDPEKETESELVKKVELINQSSIDYVLVGGSTVDEKTMEAVCSFIYPKINQPLIIFPGGAHQITPHCDSILFLSLISGDNSQFLIQEQVKAVEKIEKYQLPTISTGYILADGGVKTSVSQVSKTTPMDQSHVEEIRKTAVAGTLLGLSSIYIDAGSGALQHVSSKIIQTVRNSIDTPLIIGGGIKSSLSIQEAFEHGANLVVVGNYIEENPEFIERMKKN